MKNIENSVFTWIITMLKSWDGFHSVSFISLNITDIIKIYMILKRYGP